MTTEIYNALTPPERVAHLLQEHFHDRMVNEKLGVDADECLYELNSDDFRAIEALLKDWDAYREKYAALQTRLYVVEQQPKMPANKWLSADKQMCIILSSVTGYGIQDDDLMIHLENTDRTMRIIQPKNKKSFIDAFLKYREWRDATD